MMAYATSGQKIKASSSSPIDELFAFFPWLHLRHAAARLSSSSHPPSFTLTMWSASKTVPLTPARDPQYRQVKPSRANTDQRFEADNPCRFPIRSLLPTCVAASLPQQGV